MKRRHDGMPNRAGGKAARGTTPEERTLILAQRAAGEKAAIVARRHALKPGSVRDMMADARRKGGPEYLNLREEVRNEVIDRTMHLVHHGLLCTTDEEIAAMEPGERVKALQQLSMIYRSVVAPEQGQPTFVQLNLAVPQRQDREAWESNAVALLPPAPSDPQQ